MSVKYQSIKHHKGHFNAQSSCLAFLTSNCSINRPVYLEQQGILIMFMVCVVGAKH